MNKQHNRFEKRKNHKQRPASKRPAFAPRDSNSQVSQSKLSSPRIAEQLQTGDRITVEVKKIGINGEGVGYYERKAVFIPGALPGELVQAQVEKALPNYIQAKLLSHKRTSAERVTPPCPVYEACGGCSMQHTRYEEQLRAKENVVRDAFSRYTKLTDLPLRPIIGMNDPWAYRNKAQMQVGFHQGAVQTGLYAPGSHQLVDLSGCPVQHPDINALIQRVKEWLKAYQVSIYQERKRKGLLRNLVVRIAYTTGEMQLTFVTSEAHFPQAKSLVAAIRREFPKVVGIAQNINPKKTSIIFGDQTTLLWGKETLQEKLGDLKYELSPRAFFQLNPAQTLHLYRAAEEAAQLTGTEEVLDLYCGTGTISLWLARSAKKVTGIELVKEAIEDAKANARLNHIDNAVFITGKAEEWLPSQVAKGYKPDVIVVDPPRTGCDDALLKAIIQAKPKRMVYVSCNPSTLAKDCAVLLKNGFQLEWLQPVDMFPQTAHVECLILMVRK
ncbi:23S rRNA (uracil(1939)-C(5))-methyltransferase RlmD [Marinicrinis sediminis]|uniref:23S rRNA (Uracil(1939)-C(5))-methyltransferase RlmD n=1 Tax=Marinicrinis sediminis TaxID=1652465 RepID=A0ABW5R842_9BACL